MVKAYGPELAWLESKRASRSGRGDEEEEERAQRGSTHETRTAHARTVCVPCAFVRLRARCCGLGSATVPKVPEAVVGRKGPEVARARPDTQILEGETHTTTETNAP